MENQHEQIMGYRDLSRQEIDLMNTIKDFGVDLGGLCDKLADCVDTVDQRWVSIGKTHLQQGIMALVRAVARPTTF